ncbi:hypothetical protein K440DRAFT_55349 [Wilcoxina mikolae CBS 423.85]|nr:hypothetical protein K440DRAFT_55349 [Wilcoxina mikolae CBS 423.85]
MGGLVVKQALATAARGTSESDLAILRSCVGIFLFGVPNRGLNTENLETLVKGQRNETLVRNLSERSPLLCEMHHAFQQSFPYKDCSIVLFYETKDTKTVEVQPTGRWTRTGPFVRLVTRDSATSFSPAEALHDQIPIDTDHSNLIKFAGRDDRHYDVVRVKLSAVIKMAPDILRMRGVTRM